jgi:hypothetical protein
VYYAKVTIVGGVGNTTGGTTSFDTIATATGGLNASGCCAGADGSFSVSTTRLTQQVGVSYSCTRQYITSYGNGGGDYGGQGTFYLENLIPGTIFRITIGVGGTQSGVCLIEY